MPNHVSNTLTLHCDPATAARVFAEIGGPPDDEGFPRLIDFNKLIPYPKEFADADRAAQEWLKRNPDKKYGEGPKDGYNRGGHEWCKAHWGTKWHAYWQHRVSDTEIEFCTAWSTAEPVFEALSAKYPELSFSVAYSDECNEYEGVLEYTGLPPCAITPEDMDAPGIWFYPDPGSDMKPFRLDVGELDGSDADAA